MTLEPIICGKPINPNDKDTIEKLIEQTIGKEPALTETEIRLLESVPVYKKYGLALIAVAGPRHDPNKTTGEDIIIMARHCCYCQNLMTYQGKEIYLKREDMDAIMKDKEKFPYPITSGIGQFCHDYAFKQVR
jgi:hypothetical protein